MTISKLDVIYILRHGHMHDAIAIGNFQCKNLFLFNYSAYVHFHGYTTQNIRVVEYTHTVTVRQTKVLKTCTKKLNTQLKRYTHISKN